MTGCCDALENLVKMDFRSPGEGVSNILPIENKNTQGGNYELGIMN